MNEERHEIFFPLIRFEYSFDAEVLDADTRAELAGAMESRQAKVMSLMAEIRTRIERCLVEIPGLRTDVGLSELRCPGVADFPLPTEHP